MIQIKASLSVVDRKVLARSADTKPHSTDGMNERIGLLAVDLFADASDIDVDDVGGGVKAQIPYMLQQHRARHHPALIADQIFQQLELARQQLDGVAAAAHRSRHQIELKIADAQHCFLDDGIAAPRQRLDAGQQFRKTQTA